MVDTVALSSLGYDATNGAITITAEDGAVEFAAGKGFAVHTGDGAPDEGDGSGDGGALTLLSGQGAHGGAVSIEAGASPDVAGYGGAISLQAGSGNGAGAVGGEVSISAGSSNSGNGGNLFLSLGLALGAGDNGNLIITSLPTANPSVAGALWNDGGALKISAG